MLRVEPIIIVHMARMYPTMFALRALFNRVCIKAASPICAKIHPKATTISKAGEVLLKKGVSRTKAPSKKNIRFDTNARMKLKVA